MKRFRSRQLIGITLVTLVLLALPILPKSAYSHSGRTDSSGGHTCRTNCPSYGLDYDEYHYHNGGSAPKPASTPIATPPPTWQYEGRTYYSLSAYNEAKRADEAAEEAEEELLIQQEELEEQEAEIERLQKENEELESQVVADSDNLNAEIETVPKQSTGSNTGAATVGTLGLMGGIGWYVYRNRKAK